MSFELEVAKRMLEEVKSKNSLLLDEYENFKKEIEELKLRHTYLDSIITFKNQKGLNPQAFKEHFGFDELTQNLLKKKKNLKNLKKNSLKNKDIIKK
ncbi:hypothetical protein QKW34_15300 [Bacillus licheniformis]|nr:hypothetical protein QKW34_15300 [Bacillus licheniformis]